jgi:hypothetical protein
MDITLRVSLKEQATSLSILVRNHPSVLSGAPSTTLDIITQGNRFQSISV